jgi:hypothetical protein
MLLSIFSNIVVESLFNGRWCIKIISNDDNIDLKMLVDHDILLVIDSLNF